MAGIFKFPARIGKSLSGKVLALTVIFVMLGEVLIFLPSIANFRIQWLKARIAQAEIAALAAEAAPGAVVEELLRTEILKGAGVLAVSLKRGEAKQLMLRNTEIAVIETNFDLRGGMYYTTAWEAVRTLFRTQDRIIGVVDFPPNMSGDLIEVALHEAPMATAMRKYGLNILVLSIVLSLVVAAMIYAALNRVLVRPMKRLSANMMAFGDMPEDSKRVIVPSSRSDEIGTAEHELHDMQSQLQNLLHQKNRLAALGLAVSKVSHDLRNMLTSAQLISDRLGEVKDPNVQRFAPRLITSLDRAILFLNETLKFGRAQELPPQRVRLNLRETAREVLESFELSCGERIALLNEVASDVTIQADREQLNRVVTNLVRNAVQALDTSEAIAGQIFFVAIRGARHGSVTSIEIADNGPGIPMAVRGKVFEAFQSAQRSGGTGLGLAISTELVVAHGGTIEVKETSENGTVFMVMIPDQPVEIATFKAAARTG